MSAQSELLCQTYVTTETNYFVDSVRNIGFLNKEMYEEFVKKLAVTKMPYEITMSHYKSKMYPQEIELEQISSYSTHYQAVYHEDILETILETERYSFGRGDFFSVSIEKKGETWNDRIQNFLLGRNFKGQELQVIYGGAIRDEIR